MFKIFDEKINGILLVIIFPFLLFLMSYYGFESSYIGMKDMEKAPDFMFSSVYAYRVIPNFLSVHVTEAVTYAVDHFLPFTKSFLLKNGTLFYHSTFLINVVFFIASSIILNTIFKFNTAKILLNVNIRRVVHLLAVFFMVIVQYVPTNCDSIAIFFYVWGMLLTLRYFHFRKNKDLIGLSLIIVVSTFVRETACLNIAFFGALFISLKELTKGKVTHWKEVLFLVISFIVPYIILRLMIRQDASFFEGIYIVKNFTSPYNLAGLLFGAIGFYLTYKLCEKDNKEVLKKYLFFSSPYLLMITLVGIFWEARLFLPLILTGFAVASHQFKNIIPSNS
ncbi:hypothetical protein [Chryseobacterium sp. CT-SW4]|uniref:hypothetical protein n=1 Tax=Chryseobacterium sp. SW-1 TaxID=3157343 RepID=UPI003B011EA0